MRIVYALLLQLMVAKLGFAVENLICPDKLRLASGSIVEEDVPAGYTPLLSKQIVRLSRASVFDAPPEEGATLMPSSSSANGESAEWAIEGSYPKGKWISCDYANGLIKLSRQVQEPVSACTSTVNKTPPYNTLQAKLFCARS